MSFNAYNKGTLANGASHENLAEMKRHVQSLEKCASAYFRDIQLDMKRGPDYDLQSRFTDWNYVKLAMERITEDFANRLEARARQPAPALNMWETIEPKYGKRDRDWERSAPRTSLRSSNFVEEVRPEALWYEPSSDFTSPGRLWTERVPDISPVSRLTTGASKNKPSIMDNTPKTSSTTKTLATSVTPKTNVKAESKPSDWVPPHLRGPQKKTPAAPEKVIKPESTDKTVKPKQSAWIPPHLRGAPAAIKKPVVATSKVAAAGPEKPKEYKVPPHLRGSSKPVAAKVTHYHQRCAPVTPPAAATSTASSRATSSANSPVSSSSESSSNVLIDISDSPATVFETSAGNMATHGTKDVWEALMQLTNEGLLANTSTIGIQAW
ncbi:hypothetical protein PG993_004644 [Apiospora rasikravindrae]|uniref:Uncharacterized protein n=1 Tax=Apiospora rasikravindrae TaxID=990691 RepID=A0ABR1TDB9_9PEZI